MRQSIMSCALLAAVVLASCLVIAVPSGSDAETIGDGDVPTYTITIKDAEGLTKYVTTESG